MYINKNKVLTNLTVVKTATSEKGIRHVSLLRDIGNCRRESDSGLHRIEGNIYDESIYTIPLDIAIQNILKGDFRDMWSAIERNTNGAGVETIRSLTADDVFSFLQTEEDKLYVAANDADVAYFLSHLPENTPALLLLPCSDMEVMEQPYSTEEIIKRVDKDGRITGIIRVELKDIVNYPGVDLEDTLDLFSERLVGSPLLCSIDYEVVGHEPNNSLLIKVTGDTELLGLDDYVGEKLCRFDEMVEKMDYLKQVMVFCRIGRNDSAKFPKISAIFDDTMESIKEHLKPLLDSNAVLNGPLHGQELVAWAENIISTATDIVPQSVKDTMKDILQEAEDADEKWYYCFLSESAGKFWNEVPMPEALEKAFHTYLNILATGIPGMLGGELPMEPAHTTYTNETVGIALYDLSDTMVVFKDEKSAEAFYKLYGVEPSEFYYWSEGGWSA